MSAPLLLHLYGNDNDDGKQHEHWNIFDWKDTQTVTVGEANTVVGKAHIDVSLWKKLLLV